MLANARAKIAGYVARNLPPWWRWRLYSKLTGNPCAPGSGRRMKWVRIAPHGYKMLLGRVDWMERYALYARCYYDATGIELISNILCPGDAFIDVGANIGFVTLPAARSVGPDGSVFAIEANPALVHRLDKCVITNGLRHVHVIHSAAGSEDGNLSLRVGSQHGISRIAAGDGCVDVPVRRGDDLCPIPDHDRPIFIKIDVEGFEKKVLDGFTDILSRQNVAAYVEVIPSYLANYGDAPADIFAIMRKHGFTAHIARLGMFSGLKIAALDERDLPPQCDVLFVKGEFCDRMLLI